MESDILMLDKIRQDAEMGRDAIKHVMKFTENSSLHCVLKHQLESYEQFYQNASDLLKEYGGAATNVNPIAKAATYTATSMKTLTNRSTPHIAELVIQGNTMGITTMTGHLNDYQGECGKVLSLAKRQVRMEQENIEELKKFL